MDEFVKIAKVNPEKTRQMIEQQVSAAKKAQIPSARDQAFADALQMARIFTQHYPHGGYSAFRHIISAAAMTPLTTQVAINYYKDRIESGHAQEAREVAEILIGHSRITERKPILDAVIDTLPDVAKLLGTHNPRTIPFFTLQAVEWCLSEPDQLKKAMKACWAVIPRIDIKETSIAHHIIYGAYGIAKRFRTEDRDNGLNEYIAGGRSAMQDIVLHNTPCAIIAAEAIEKAAREIQYGKKFGLYSYSIPEHDELAKKNFFTPEFARVGTLPGLQTPRNDIRSRWIFAVCKEGETSFLTFVKGPFEDAEPDDGKKLNPSSRSLIENTRNQFGKAARGEVTIQTAAQHAGSTMSHFNLDAYKQG